ncbi:MAG: glycoside hydrolase family 97 N-terminal domain-containing protein, partial [Gemmatimonadetes bacterium]|nr:glycoside hydrolase family 97 N-terminal domain-containing protein [Gemmatimonadota bacterium]
MTSLRLAACAALALCLAPAAGAQGSSVTSPDGRTVVSLAVTDGQLRWSVARDGRPVVMPSRLGFTFRHASALGDSLRLADSVRSEFDERFTMPLGEVATVRDQHRELRVKVVETTAAAREFWVTVRVFDDGLGFRYELPAQPNLKDFEIMDELTEFSMAEDMKAWWIPANISTPDRQEMLFSSGHISKLDLVQTPLTLVGTSGLHVVIHEANLVDYAGMALQG